MGVKQLSPTIVYEDNKSAILLATNQTKPKDTSKHLAMRYHYCKQAIIRGDVILRYIPTEHQLADIFTKHIKNHKQFRQLRDQLMNILPESC